MTKSKIARVRKRPNPVQPPMTKAACEARIPVPEPPKFGLGFIHLHQGTIVLGVSGPSFTTFRSKADAAEWLRGLARSIELSYPTG